jgi:hypothetical protein
MGYDHVDRHVFKQSRDIVSDAEVAKDNCKSAADAANDFNHVMHEHRGLDAVHAHQTGISDEKKGDNKCAAANNEIAGADILDDQNYYAYGHKDKSDEARGYYEDAGRNRMQAGKKEAAANNHGEAARNYRKAQADYKLAGDLARDDAEKKGDNYDKKADGYYKKAEEARKAAEKEETAGKAAKDASPASNDPKNKP